MAAEIRLGNAKPQYRSLSATFWLPLGNHHALASGAIEGEMLTR
jgi:hypothetical protein